MSGLQSERVNRRGLLAGAAGGAAALGLGATFLPDLFGSDAAKRGARAAAGRAGYGRLSRPDAHGIKLPRGFSARMIARAGQKVPGTDYLMHAAPDGAATFRTRDGGWIMVSNSEMQEGGAGALRFDSSGRVASAYRVLDGTEFNCSGGATPWDTWLSCEEVVHGGYVWEVDPWGRRPAVKHEAMGRFKHEAAAVDPVGRHVYLTEDLMDGKLYRFTPARWPRLDEGLLEAAVVDRYHQISWIKVPDPLARTTQTRHQVPAAFTFYRAEGIWRWDRGLYVGTTMDSTLRRIDLRTNRIETVYTVDWDKVGPAGPVLNRIDQMTASPAGEVFIAEDNGEAELALGVLDPPDTVTRFLTISGPEHKESEITGVAFDPSGKRLYFSSQRAFGHGAIYEVTGPFTSKPS